jgi:hypothetical protein
MLKVYYSSNPQDLYQVRASTTWWLPEKLTPPPSMDQLYLDGQTIATSHPNVLPGLQAAIRQGLIQASQVLYFNLDEQPPVVYTFNLDGSISSFWPLSSSAANPGRNPNQRPLL